MNGKKIQRKSAAFKSSESQDMSRMGVTRVSHTSIKSLENSNESFVEKVLRNANQLRDCEKGIFCSSHPARKALYCGKNAAMRHCLDCAIFEELQASGYDYLTKEQSKKVSKVLALHEKLEELMSSNRSKAEMLNPEKTEQFDSLEAEVHAIVRSYFAEEKAKFIADAEQVQRAQSLVGSYVDDIKDNFIDIITTIEKGNFEEIMNEYSKELAKLENKSGELHSGELPVLNEEKFRRQLMLCLTPKFSFDSNFKTQKTCSHSNTPPSAAPAEEDPHKSQRSSRSSKTDSSDLNFLTALAATTKSLHILSSKISNDIENDRCLTTAANSLLKKVNGVLGTNDKFGKLSKICIGSPAEPRLHDSFLRMPIKNNVQTKRSSNEAISEKSLFQLKRGVSATKSMGKTNAQINTKVGVKNSQNTYFTKNEWKKMYQNTSD